MELAERLTTAARWLRDADGILITAGAAMCVDSGLPDFRDEGAFWRAYPALKAHGIGFQDIANGEAFRRDPVHAWGFYGHWLNLYRRTAPHVGFDILCRWASTKEHGVFVFTGNIDGQFQKAGFERKRILECHGSLHRLQCSRPCSPDTWSANDLDPEVDEEHCRLVSELPRCQKCGSVVRPNVLLFTDDDWNDYAVRRQRMRFEAWLLSAERKVVIEVGASRTALSGQSVPRTTTSPVIRIGPDAYDVNRKRDIGIRGCVLDTLRKLDESIG
ncbi:MULTISPECIES: SIR2 family NAD-dependent protein deacylase [Burkholderia]|uniref:SIR2 family NAD-dependent protein deacylase n=1 Tax=Burkholderia TaxID=32008 RepID=UPI003AF560C6